MDALTLLRNDHREVESLFAKIEGGLDEAALETAGRQIIEELSRHAAVEEQVLYPAVERALPNHAKDILKSLEAHHAVKSILAEVDRLTAGSDRYEAKLLVLIDSVRQHVEEEERELFPTVEAALSADQLDEIGDLIDQAKRVAPTKPHPHAPDTPPANFLNLAVAVVDQVRTAGEKTLRRVTQGSGRGSSNGKNASSSKSTAKKSTKSAAKPKSTAESTKSVAVAKKSTKPAAKSTKATAKKSAKTAAKKSARPSTRTTSKSSRSR